MSTNTATTSATATTLETVRLLDERSDAQVLVSPARGGMVTRFDVRGRPVLFLDHASLVDTSKNVRGGVPVLFPSPGPLAGDRFTWGGRSGSMKQHGFARQRAWSVASSDERQVTLKLAADAATLEAYPWEFALRYRYVLEGAKLRIEQHVENRASEPMPFAAGFHPYFFVRDADKGRARVPTTATRAWDNVTKREVGVEAPVDLTQKEVDVHLIDHGRTAAELVLGDGARIAVRGSAEYTRWVIWTLAGKDFVCLEPWTAPADALNTGASVIVVPPGGSHELWCEIEAEVAS